MSGVIERILESMEGVRQTCIKVVDERDRYAEMVRILTGYEPDEIEIRRETSPYGPGYSIRHTVQQLAPHSEGKP